MDALSDVLRAVRLTGAIFFDVHASGPWVAETPEGESIVGAMFPGSEHLISYHVLTRGQLLGERRRASRPCCSRPATSSCCPTATRTCCRARQGCVARPTCRCIACRAMASCRSASRWARPEARARAVRVRLPGVRCPAVQPVAGRVAAGHPRERYRQRRARHAREVRAHRIQGAAHRRRGRAEPFERVDVRRRGASISRDPACRPHRTGSRVCATRSSAAR